MNFRIPGDVIFRLLGDEAVILSLSAGMYFGLDSVGTRIWQLISENASSEKIIETLCAEYEVEEDQPRRSPFLPELSVPMQPHYS